MRLASRTNAPATLHSLQELVEFVDDADRAFVQFGQNEVAVVKSANVEAVKQQVAFRWPQSVFR
jgi:hypothetical protein